MRITQNWLNTTVTAITDRSPTVREFELLPEYTGTLSYGPGAHIQVRLPISGIEPQTRSYSLIGLPNARCYRIAVKRMDMGRGGSLHMWQLTAGDQLLVSGPQNHFPLSFDAPEYLLIAGGIGVTPLLSMAQALSEHASRAPVAVRMLYAARHHDEFAYAETLRQSLGDALQCFDSSVDETIDFAAEIATLHPLAQVYCCGPIPMLDSLKQAWAASARPLQNLRFETFGNSGHNESTAFTVHLPRHHLELTVAADVSLLDALQSAGVAVLQHCRRGECGVCALDVLTIDGELDHRDVFLSAQQKQCGQQLCACVSRATGRITLDSAFR